MNTFDFLKTGLNVKCIILRHFYKAVILQFNIKKKYVHSISVCTVYIYYVCINTHTCMC